MFMEKGGVGCDIGVEFHAVLCIDWFNLVIVSSMCSEDSSFILRLVSLDSCD